MWYNGVMAVAPGIGRTLARLAALTPYRAPEGDTRSQILRLVAESPEPVSVEWLCEQTGLHANTVRGHLDVLLAAGQIERTPGPRRGRGRPPMLYAAMSNEAPLYADLVATLVDQLGENTDSALVDDAASRWAEVVADRAGPATDLDDAVDRAAEALDRLGFSAQVSPVGDSITLGSCPYAALVRDQPVICDIHTALLRDLLDRTGQPVKVGDMEVFPAPGMCRAHLERPDRSPEWVIPGSRDRRATDTPAAPKRAKRRSKGTP